ncbi:uncharacterized protein BX663DRAFT_327253 [Cokeromyces recurvatus]|uniref:uncharacterized protein n=1 Tax=Cokeromyces recurvatus TaxID=90255 RepID=UPI00221FF0DD|nr:uncharacterized protein BX663DRAFT_327253 [Cokeromyces recurvatus]KAI7904757.1 hypothetical protein BX663DRAFT_327253 [Cokeromyces recurvatus]
MQTFQNLKLFNFIFTVISKFCTTNTFFYEDRQKYVYNEQRVKVFDFMEDILIQITDTNIFFFENYYPQRSHLETRKSLEEKVVEKSNDIKSKAAIKPKS